MFLHDLLRDAVRSDGLEILEKTPIQDPNLATELLSLALFEYPKTVRCIRYLLDNYEIKGKDIVGYYVSPLLHKQQNFRLGLYFLKRIVERGYKIDHSNLQSAVHMGVNTAVLDYMFSLPEEKWASLHNHYRIPFLVHHIMWSKDPNYFKWLARRFMSRMDPEILRIEMNQRYLGGYLYPLQSLATYYDDTRNGVQHIPKDYLPMAFYVAKMLIDHGADPYHDLSVLYDHRRYNPHLASFIESYAQQRVAYQMIKELLKIEKKTGNKYPLDVLTHISTSHMQKENPYTQRFIEGLYKRYYSRNSYKR